MSNEIDFKKIVSDYILVGILGYIAIIILIVLVRCLIIRKIYIPKTCEECLACVKYQKCCPEGCSACKKTRNQRGMFCCIDEETRYDVSCLDRYPSIGVRCFKPKCTNITCLCCEIFVENEMIPEDAYIPTDQLEENGAEEELLNTSRSSKDAGAKGDG